MTHEEGLPFALRFVNELTAQRMQQGAMLIKQQP